MLQTLFHIPHELPPGSGWTVFGFGWALAIWVVVCVVWLLMLARLQERRKELAGALPLMLLVAVMIVFVAPRIEEQNAAGQPIGIPIRGYGVMMLAAIVTGVGLAGYRAKRMGIEPEVIFSLALWMCIAGIVGARGFYVVQKWDQFQSDNPMATIVKILSFTEGGLVVFGSAIGALLALVAFCRLRKLPPLAIADLVAPSMMVGLAIGRIGCLLNGCCYGGYCELPLALRFPPEAPVYVDQLVSGEMFGARMTEQTNPETGKPQVVIADVRPGSKAAESGLKTGEVVEYLAFNGARYKIHGMQNVRDLFAGLTGQSSAVSIAVNEHEPWVVAGLPERSLPVHPTQVYSAIDALLLALVLWFFYPFRRRDGEVVALMLTLHPISRFLLEVVRIDEPGALGTPFTISQLVGFGFIAAAVALWLVIERRPAGSALPLSQARPAAAS